MSEKGVEGEVAEFADDLIEGFEDFLGEGFDVFVFIKHEVEEEDEAEQVGDNDFR